MIYKVKKVNHPHDIVTSVPGSKSITNRALLIAALASGRSVLKGVFLVMIQDIL
jgi:3-phosphoshikimate 1-carboxyvinyltransferase